MFFRYPFHPRVTAVARKRSMPFFQMCRWQVTAKNTCTLRMWLSIKWHWLSIKWHCKLVHDCMVYTKCAPKPPAALSRDTSVRACVRACVRVCVCACVRVCLCRGYRVRAIQYQWLHIGFEFLGIHCCRSCKALCAHPCRWDTALKNWPFCIIPLLQILQTSIFLQVTSLSVS